MQGNSRAGSSRLRTTALVVAAALGIALLVPITAEGEQRRPDGKPAGNPVGNPAGCGRPTTPTSTFDGGKLLTLSDATMPASAFLDGRFRPDGRDTRGQRDTLTALDLPLHVALPRQSDHTDRPVVSGEVEAENSVIGPPYGMDVSPNGRFAYILRTRGNPPPDVDRVDNVFTDLPGEAVVLVVDIGDTRAPKVVQRIRVGKVAHTLSLSPDGTLLAINTDEPGRNLRLRKVGPDGLVSKEILATGGSDPGRPVRRVGRVEWHPSGRFLAHTLPFENELRFYRVVRGKESVVLRPWGAPVTVGKFPDEGAFTSDGAYYLTTDLQWGDDVPGLFVDPPPGTITAVRFDDAHGRHRVTGRAPTDVSPEGIAISPDGRHVVTGNLTHSWLPWNDERLRRGSSMDLLELDRRSGALRAVQRIQVNGILPEGLTFDETGDHLALTVYDKYDPRTRRGAVEFFALQKESRDSGRCARLAPTNVEIELPPGPHTALLVPARATRP